MDAIQHQEINCNLLHQQAKEKHRAIKFEAEQAFDKNEQSMSLIFKICVQLVKFHKYVTSPSDKGYFLEIYRIQHA